MHARYNGMYGHGEVALGLNQNYNNTTKQIRNQLSSADKKRYDALIKTNPAYYKNDIKVYNSVPDN
jgi:hypothetical protein